MRRTSIMLLRSFFPSFLMSIAFFSSILQLADLYANLLKYAENNVGALKIIQLQLLFLPFCIAKGLPTAILFATCFTIGNCYIHNELIVVLTVGISLKRFVLPIIVVGIIFSFALFGLQEYIMIDAQKEHDRLQKEYLGDTEDTNINDNFFLSDKHFTIIYNVSYYEETKETKTLFNVTAVIRDEDKKLQRKLSFDTASWLSDKEMWQLSKVQIYRYDKNANLVKTEYYETYIDDYLTTPPKNFRKLHKDLEKERKEDALIIINTLKAAGLPYKSELTHYYQRYTFSITPLIVVIIAVSVGSRLRKNILLMSLFISVALSVVYYVSNMVSVLMGSNGMLSPLIGSLGSVAMFFIIAVVLLLTSKT